MVFRGASTKLSHDLNFEIIIFHDCVVWRLFCSGFEHFESERIYSMYPSGRHLSTPKVSFETAVRSHLLAALLYGADNRFIGKAEC